MKRLLLITLLFALMNTGCEDKKDDKLGYSFPKKSKETYYNEAGDITREDNFYWEGNTLTRYYLDNGEETDKKQYVIECNKYGSHIKRTFYICIKVILHIAPIKIRKFCSRDRNSCTINYY